MTAALGFVRRRPVASYFILAFAIAWGGILLLTLGFGRRVLIGSSGASGAQGHMGALDAVVLLLWFAGPSLSSVLLTAHLDGRAGLRELRARLAHWRVGTRWYAVAILGAPLLVLSVLLPLSQRSPDFVPALLTTESPITLLVFGIVWGLVGGGFLEELGWTGFAVPRLRRTHGARTTALIVGANWGGLHLILAGWGRSTMVGSHPQATYALGLLAFYGGVLPGYRVLMVWVHDRSGSLPIAMLMHASLSACTLIFAPPAKGMAYALWNLALAAAVWAAAGLVSIPSGALATRRLHSRHSS